MIASMHWSLIVALTAACLAVCFLLASGVIYVKYKLSLKANIDHFEVASPRVLAGLLRLVGAYFFTIERGRIKIINALPGEEGIIERRLHERSDVKEFISNALSSGQNSSTASLSMQMRIALTGEEKHWYEIRFSAFRYNLRSSRTRGIIIPIDNIKQREKEAMEIHRRTLNAEERDDFIREMNHAVRTPLNAIVGFSEILADPDMEITPEDLAEYSKVIDSNAKSLTKVLENVLTISHLGSENLMLNDSYLNVPELVRSVVAENEEYLVEEGIVTQEDPSPQECSIFADEKIMRRVIQILIENVIQHASSGKSLTYGWKESLDGVVEIYIKDKGPGISESDLPFIFKAFYKADPFSAGSGQSLTIAKGYMESEKAEIKCDTSSQGSTFFLRFRNVVPAIAFIPFGGISIMILALVGLYFSIVLFRYALTYRGLRKAEEEAISRTISISGGHLFKYKNDKILMTRQTAEYFSFSSNQIGLDIYLDSMDEADKNVIMKIKNAPKGEIVSDFLSLPNFTTFKIMSFSCVATQIRDDDGEYTPMGMFFSIDEAHARLEAMREVYAKEEEAVSKQSFIANMGHEIRNPLNAIVGFSNLLSDIYFEIDKEERASYADIIQQSNEHLLSLLDGALLSAKEQDKLLKSSLNVIPISDLMEELYKTNSVIVPSKLSFEFERGDEAYAKMSRTGMRQIVSNLINNACKFTAKGTITFGWKTTENEIKIFVRDTGIGMTPENVENVFKKFFKADSSTSGAGIGLPLCKRLSEMMDGKLTVESEYGKGSCFAVVLPRIETEETNS